jgi:hypothetical protein
VKDSLYTEERLELSLVNSKLSKLSENGFFLLGLIRQANFSTMPTATI